MTVWIRYTDQDDYDSLNELDLIYYEGTDKQAVWNYACEYQEKLRETVSGFSFTILNEYDEIVGTIGLYGVVPIAPYHFGTVGYAIGKKYRGNGYADAALHECIDFAFNDIGLKRLTSCISPRNINSKKILINAGFDFECKIRGYFNGHDAEQYVLLKME